MSIFGSIMNRIFHHEQAGGPTGGNPAPAAQATAAPSPAPGSDTPQQADTPLSGGQTGAAAPVDVGAVLSSMAAMADNGGGNYRSSIVDLLKLLGLDSSLDARRQLAHELDVHAGEAGSAEENIALHRAVIDKLAANGGIVPDDLRQ